jgi:pimeloyl-ACP methyl ester carboxylesterase
MLLSLAGAIGALLLAAVLIICALNWLFPLVGAGLLRGQLRKKAGLAQASMSVDGRSIPYLAGGRGEALILVHGFTSNKDVFNALARHLTPHFTVYAPDLPGFGDTARDMQARYSVDGMVAYLRQFAHGLGLRRVHLCGSSLGGAVVAHYAAQHPDEVASVWLIGAAATHEFLTDSAMIRHYDATGEFPYLVRTREAHARKLEIVFGGPVRMPYCVEQALATAAIRDFDMHSEILRQMRPEPPIESLYGELATPALISCGDHDLVVPPASAQTLAQLFRDSTVKIMAGLGHLPMMERPHACARDYLAFRACMASPS